jgi:hypothetical protein
MSPTQDDHDDMPSGNGDGWWMGLRAMWVEALRRFRGHVERRDEDR